jgi:2-polyprenyl-6-methoxyphenol hydroxylase-like FAD-dependent oxidoreductase
MLERQQFPRFSIGESLLPQSMEYIEAAGLLQDVVEAGFQYKNGAAFVHGEARTAFDFRKKFSPGWGTTYQVQRADFDNVLARGAERMGTTLRFGDEVLSVEAGEQPAVTCAARTAASTASRPISSSTPRASHACCRACCSWNRRPTSRCAARSSATCATTFRPKRTSTATRS